LTLVAISALTLPGCATMRVNSFVQRGADLNTYRTYGWTGGEEPTGDPRLDNNPFFEERVRAAVEQQLASRGFEKSPATPDLLVHYHINVNEDVDVSLIDRETGNCYSGESDCRPFVYDAGTLIIDLVDARTNALVWRGWAADTMEGAIDNQQLMEQKIDKAVDRILQRFPARARA
jgi:hypothetical protein